MSLKDIQQKFIRKNQQRTYGLDYRFKTGKYELHTLKNVIEIDTGHIHWMIKNNNFVLDNEALEYLQEFLPF